MNALVTGAEGFIGKALVSELEPNVVGTTRKTLDLLELGDLSRFAKPDVLYLCAYKSRFIECERDPTAYRINVDAQIELASFWHSTKVVFLSSEAVESAIHTAYGMHKALAEVGLRAVCNPIIARICGKVSASRLPMLAQWLVDLAHKPHGVYRWG